MAKKGRKSKYDELDIAVRLPEIEGMARDGYRDEDIWRALGVARQTFYNWQEKYPEFAEAIKKGKYVVDAEIENKLLDNAKGHIVWEETQELTKVPNPETGRMEEKMVTTKRQARYIKPDTTAQIFWLKNRKPHAWRDKQHLAHEGQLGITNLDYMSDEELNKALNELKD